MRPPPSSQITETPLADALIAATAQAREALLVNRDEHMRQIPAELVRQKFPEAEPSERGF